MSLDELLTELETFGAENDSQDLDYSRRMLNITPDTGQFLEVLVKATAARRILEIGTSNGYSTLWLARAARLTGGLVTTIELTDFKYKMALENFERSGLSPWIRPVQGDAGELLPRTPDFSVDFLFLDTYRTFYASWWPHLRRVLRLGGLLVADNATSHPQEMEPLRTLIDADPEFTSVVAPVGKGELMAVRARRAGPD